MEIFILIIHFKACSDWHWQICKPFGIDVKKIECIYEYRQISNIRRTKSQNLNVSRLVLQLSLRSILKPGVKSRMKM